MGWMIALILIGLFIIISILLLLQQLTINVTYCYQKDFHYINLIVHLARFRVFQKKINLNQEQDLDETSQLANLWKGFEQDKELKNFSQLMKKIMNQLKTAKRVLKISLQHITIKEFSWKTNFGTGDAGSTGLAAGGLWIVKGALVGLVSEVANLSCYPAISVIPYFQQKGFQSEINCMVSIRLGKAIHTIVQIQRHGVKKAIYT